jgi:hypothetical protein
MLLFRLLLLSGLVLKALSLNGILGEANGFDTELVRRRADLVRRYVAENSSPITSIPSGTAKIRLAAGTEKSLLPEFEPAVKAGGDSISMASTRPVKERALRSRERATRLIV